MEQKPLLSVIVPVYKVEAYLPQCVDSLCSQTYPNLEIILVDDGSPDRCGALCDDYARRDSRFRVIHKENGGLSDARNAGIEAATGEYLAFADSDDWLEPDAYQALMEAALRHRAELVCAGRYDEEEGACTVGLCPEREELVSGTELVRRIFHWDHLDSAAWDKLYARRLFRDIRYPVGRVVEDVPTTYRIALLAGGGVLLPKPVYHYRHRSGSITQSAVSPKSFHFSQHAAQVYQDICQNYPELEPDAHYLLVCAIRHNAAILSMADPGTRKCYRQEYRSARRAIVRELPFVFRCGFFSGKEKLQLVLYGAGLFAPALKLYHFVKRAR